MIDGYRKDAEGASRWVLAHLRTKKNRTEMTAETFAWIARWAFRHGERELRRLEQNSLKRFAAFLE